MIIFVAVKIAVLPASQYWPTERRGMWRSGMQWHWVDDWGKARGRKPLEVTCIVVLFAAIILNPLGVEVSSSTGVMVQPVATAIIGVYSHHFGREYRRDRRGS